MSATPTKTIRPFTFDQSFDTLHDLEDEAEKQQEEEEVVPSYSEEELQAAREQAYKLGLEAGQQEIRSSLEQQIATTLEIVASTLGRVHEVQVEANERIARETVDIAIAATRKLLPSMVEQYGAAEVETLVGETLSKVLDQPRVTIRVSGNTASDIEQRLHELAAKVGFPGELRIVPDDELGSADCRILWSDGEAMRQVQSILDDLGGLVSDLPRSDFQPEALAPAMPPPTPGDEQPGDAAPLDVTIDLEADSNNDDDGDAEPGPASAEEDAGAEAMPDDEQASGENAARKETDRGPTAPDTA